MAARALAVVVASVWLIPASLAAQAARAPANGPIVITHNPPSPSQQPGAGQQQNPSPPPPAAPPAPPSAQTNDVFRAGPNTYAPRYDRQSLPSRRHQRFPRGYGYGVGFGYGYVADDYSLARRAERSYDERARSGETGYLRLQIEPGTAEVYVDGLYTGTGDDVGPLSVGRALEMGPHRVEIRAPGFETVTFDVRIQPNEMITYRRTLQRVDDRIESRLPTSIAQAAPRTFYVIPRCYAGDTRPRAEALPPGCKMASLRTVPPIIAAPPR
ncbi:MAG TPA: PEGA domain-containing protein [Vicinamibacterales bacterium]|nr:PEGA domain-containing protein [Vicinamibacterales bacterium]